MAGQPVSRPLEQVGSHSLLPSGHVTDLKLVNHSTGSNLTGSLFYDEHVPGLGKHDDDSRRSLNLFLTNFRKFSSWGLDTALFFCDGSLRFRDSIVVFVVGAVVSPFREVSVL